MTREELEKAIEKHSLSPYRDQLLAITRATIGLKLKRVMDDDIPIGGSKFGGLPDLPEGIGWPMLTGFDGGTSDAEIPEEVPVIDQPTWKTRLINFFCGDPKARAAREAEDKNRHLSFVAQFNLEELHGYDADGLLPRKGMLYFFVLNELTFLDDGTVFGDNNIKVVYSASTSNLSRGPRPSVMDSYDVFHVYQLELHDGVNLPWDAALCAGLPGDKKTVRCYDSLMEKAMGYHDHLLGYPHGITGEPLSACARHEMGIDDKACDLSTTRDMALDWVNLFQVGANGCPSPNSSFKQGQMSFGDYGSLCFCIKKDDLKSGRWDRVCGVVQS